MPRKLRGLSISYDAYKELEYFCYQYGEKKKELAFLYGGRGLRMDAAGKGTRQTDQTAATAFRAMVLEEQVGMIEEAAKEAGQQLAPFLLKNVTEKMKYEYMEVPCGRRQFYAMRRLFFEILYKKKKKVEMGH